MSRGRSSGVRIAGIVLEGHKDAAVEVPFDPAERFGLEPVVLRRGRRGHRVRATAKPRVRANESAFGFEAEIVPRSKRFWLVLPASVLAELGLEPGERIELSIEPLRDPSTDRARRSARPPSGALSSRRRARRSSSGVARRGG